MGSDFSVQQIDLIIRQNNMDEDRCRYMIFSIHGWWFSQPIFLCFKPSIPIQYHENLARKVVHITTVAVLYTRPYSGNYFFNAFFESDVMSDEDVFFSHTRRSSQVSQHVKT